MYWDDQTIKETINNTNKNIGFSNNKQKQFNKLLWPVWMEE